MKFLITFVLIFILSCNKDEKIDKELNDRQTFLLLILQKLLAERYIGFPEQGCYAVYPVGETVNLKSIDMYFNGSFFFKSSIDSNDFKSQVSCEPFSYTISFKENSKINRLIVYFKKKTNQIGNDYTGVRLYFKDNSFKDYTMIFNGDPDTFTEFTVGEYRFVAVR